MSFSAFISLSRVVDINPKKSSAQSNRSSEAASKSKKLFDRFMTLHRFGCSLHPLRRIQSDPIGSTPEESGVFLIEKAKGVVLLSPL